MNFFKVLFVSGSLTAIFAQNSQSISAGTPEKLDPAKFQTRTVWMPYWSERGSQHAILHLRNSLHHFALNATVDIFSAGGTLIATHVVDLERLANADLPLALLVPAYTPEAMRTGAIRVSYSYPYEGALQVNLSMRDVNNAHAIAGRHSRIGTEKSAYLAFQVPTPDSSLEVAFVNPADKPATIRLSMRQGDAWKALWGLSLNPNASAVVRLTADTLAAGSTTRLALLKADYSGTTTEVIASAWLADENTGYSSSVLVSDEYPESNTLYATQLVARSFAASTLNAGPVFEGSLVFANIGDSPADLSGTLFCGSTSTTATNVPLTLHLKPLSVEAVSLESTVGAQATLPAVCAGEFQYSGPPGHVLGAYYAASGSRKLGLFVKLEPFTGRAHNQVYWTIQDDTIPLLSISNFGSAPDTAVISLTQANSAVEVAREAIPAHGTITVNLRDKVLSLPPNALTRGDYGGLYIWAKKPDGKLSVNQHAISGDQSKMVSYLDDFDYIVSHEISDNPALIPYGIDGTASTRTCWCSGGCYYNEYPIYSTDTSVVTVYNPYNPPEPAQVHAVGVGNASFTSTADGISATPQPVAVQLRGAHELSSNRVE